MHKKRGTLLHARQDYAYRSNFLALIGAYQLFLTFFGWYRPKNKKMFAPQKSFAVLVAAHNEEQVVGALIENLKTLDYPKELL